MTSPEQTPGALLLLPALSWPLKRLSLRTAYLPTFESILRKVAATVTNKNSVSRLDIALVLPASHPVSPTVSRASMFAKIQTLLEETYSLLCIVAAKEKIELDFPGGVDARIFFLETRADGAWGDLIGKQSLSGPLIDMKTFATSGREFTSVYTVESEDGGEVLETLLKSYSSRRKSTPKFERLPFGIAMAPSSPSNAQDNPKPAHSSVAVGGTFDHLHIGHKLLLTATVFLPEPSESKPRLIIVGITGDELLVNKKHASQVESWDDRQSQTADFIESMLVFHPDIPNIRKVERLDVPGPNGKVVRVSYGNLLIINYTQISDPFGPTITDENISALIISKETRAGGKAVNDKRAEKGWHGLEVFEVDVLDAGSSEDHGDGPEKETFESKISSTEIRRRLAEKAGRGSDMSASL